MPTDKKLTVSEISNFNRHFDQVYIQVQELIDGGYILDEHQWLNVSMFTSVDLPKLM